MTGDSGCAGHKSIHPTEMDAGRVVTQCYDNINKRNEPTPSVNTPFPLYLLCANQASDAELRTVFQSRGSRAIEM